MRYDDYYQVTLRPASAAQIEQAADRLEELSDFLHTLDEKDFDMSFWYHGKPGCTVNENKSEYCNTVACIAGWATFFHPDLRVWDTEYGNRIGYGGFMDTKAFARAFWLRKQVARDLTDPKAAHQTPKLAAIEIARLVHLMRKEAELKRSKKLAAVSTRMNSTYKF